MPALKTHCGVSSNAARRFVRKAFMSDSVPGGLYCEFMVSSSYIFVEKKPAEEAQGEIENRLLTTAGGVHRAFDPEVAHPLICKHLSSCA
jgi:hypothetical protein